MRAAQEKLRAVRPAIPQTAFVIVPRADATKATAAGGELDFLPWLRCQQRGTVVAQVPGSVAGCGCSSQEIPVYWCNRFEEPVLKWADPRNTERIRRRVPAYTGRQCKTCQEAVAE